MDMSQLSPEQAAMLGLMEEMQMKDSLRMYNSLVERCFQNCVNSFRSKSLDDREKKCIDKCAEKFLKTTQRSGLLFASLQKEFNEKPSQ